MKTYDLVIATTFVTTTLALALLLYWTWLEYREHREDDELERVRDEWNAGPYDRDYDSFGELVDLDSLR